MSREQHKDITHVDLGVLQHFYRKHSQEGLPKPKSFLDIGCGPGGMVDWARWFGLDALGIDRDDTVGRDCVHTHDLELAPYHWKDHGVDIIWAVEVAEHLAGSALQNFINTIVWNLSPAGIVIVTTAPMGCQGVGHVTLQPDWWWAKLFSNSGLVIDADLSAAAREHSTMAREFMRNTGKVFRRTS